MRNIHWLAVILVIACTAQAAAPGGRSGGGASAAPASGNTHAVAGSIGHGAFTHVGNAGSGHLPASALMSVARQSVAGHPAEVAIFKLPQPLCAADKKRIRNSGYTAYEEPGHTYFCRDQIDLTTGMLHCFGLVTAERH